jgi:hypothetical protein
MGKWVAGLRISVRERRVRGMVRVKVGSIVLLSDSWVMCYVR